MERWGVDQEEYALLILNERAPTIELSARNVEKLKLNTVDRLNVYDVLRADKIVVEATAFKYIQEFYGAASSEDAPEEASADTAPAETAPAETAPAQPASEKDSAESATA